MVRLFFRTFLVALLAGLVGLAWLGWQLRRSLPETSTEITAGVVEPVIVERRSDGLTRIQAADRIDAVQALGLAHARDQFWSMDLARRRAAGRLAEVLGESGLASDRSTRVHGFTALSERTLVGLPENQRALLRAYTEGVNAGLESLGGAPWAYRIRGLSPEPWTERDCILVLNTFFLELQGDVWLREALGGQVRERLPLEWVDPFLSGTDSQAALPGPRVFSVARVGEGEEEPMTLKEEAQEAFSLARSLPLESGRTESTPEGLRSAWHSPASLPGPWYPCQLRYRHGAEAIEVLGVTRPGSPLIWAGSNGQISWTVEPAAVDNADLVLLPHSDIDPESYYIHGTTVKKIESREETLLVRGGDPVVLPILSSPWGPIVTRGERSQHMSLRWTAYESDTLNLAFADLELASKNDEAMEIIAQAGLPPLQVHVRESSGETVTGLATRVPTRNGFDGRLPVPWTYGDRGWQGWETRPAPAPFSAAKVNDDETAFWWQELIRIARENTATGKSSDWEKLRALLVQTPVDSPRAKALSEGYVRRVTARALSPLLRRVTQKYPDFHYGYFATGGLVRTMITEKPAHLLDSRYISWDDLLLNAADDMVADLPALLRQADKPRGLLPVGSEGWLGVALQPWSLPRPPAAAAPGSIETRLEVRTEAAPRLLWSFPGGPSDHPWAFDSTSYHEPWAKGLWSSPADESEDVSVRLVLQP